MKLIIYITLIKLLFFVNNAFSFGFKKLELINCYDGDTCKFNILDDGFPSYLNPIGIRVYGVDTAEIKDKVNKELALKSKNFTTNFVKNAKNLTLSNCVKDKYFRFICVYKDGNKDLAQTLIENNLGKPYFGKSKPKHN